MKERYKGLFTSGNNFWRSFINSSLVVCFAYVLLFLSSCYVLANMDVFNEVINNDKIHIVTFSESDLPQTMLNEPLWKLLKEKDPQECEEKNGCNLSLAINEKKFIPWGISKIKIAATHCKAADKMVESIINTTYANELPLNYDYSFFTQEGTLWDRVKTYVLGNHEGKRIPDISITIVDSKPCSDIGCFGWGCQYLYYQYHKYYNFFCRERKSKECLTFSSQRDNDSDSYYKEGSYKLSNLQSPSIQFKINKYIKIKNNKINRYDCFIERAQNLISLKVASTMCLLGAASYVKSLKSPLDFTVSDNDVEISPKVIEFISNEWRKLK